MISKERISQEKYQPSTWAFTILIALYYFFIGRSPRPNQHVIDIIGPDIAVLEISQILGPGILLGGFLIGWWRLTGVRQSTDTVEKRDFFATYVGIVAVLSVLITGFVLVSIGLQVPEYGIPSATLLLLFLVLVTGYIGTCVAIGAATGVTTSRSVTGRLMAGTVLLATLFVHEIVNVIYYFTVDDSFTVFDPPADPIYFLARRVNPYHAYNVLVNWLYGIGNSESGAELTITQMRPEPGVDEVVTNAFVVGNTFDGAVPWYLSEWVAIGILIMWFGVSMAILYIGTNAS